MLTCCMELIANDSFYKNRIHIYLQERKVNGFISLETS